MHNNWVTSLIIWKCLGFLSAGKCKAHPPWTSISSFCGWVTLTSRMSTNPPSGVYSTYRWEIGCSDADQRRCWYHLGLDSKALFSRMGKPMLLILGGVSRWSIKGLWLFIMVWLQQPMWASASFLPRWSVWWPSPFYTSVTCRNAPWRAAPTPQSVGRGNTLYIHRRKWVKKQTTSMRNWTRGWLLLEQACNTPDAQNRQFRRAAVLVCCNKNNRKTCSIFKTCRFHMYGFWRTFHIQPPCQGGGAGGNGGGGISARHFGEQHPVPIGSSPGFGGPVFWFRLSKLLIVF